MRRSLLVFTVLFGLLLTSAPVLARQAASPLTDAGYPEVVIAVSDNGVLLPGTVPAGRTLVTYRNTGSDSRHAFLARLPDDAAIGSLFADMESDAPPAWLLQSTFPGFPGEVLAGQETHAIVDLTPGLYLVVEDFSGILVVVPSGGDTSSPSPVADPAADATISLFEFGFHMPETMSSGQQVWKVVNDGQAPHELLVLGVPEGTTLDDLLEIGTSGELGALPPAGGIGWLSPGATAWTAVDLAPGSYAALCFVYDPDTGLPHAMEGMVALFSVT